MIVIVKQVVKIEGSLFPDYVIELAGRLEGTYSVIVLGGGEFVNLIWDYDSKIHFLSTAAPGQLE